VFVSRLFRRLCYALLAFGAANLVVTGTVRLVPVSQ
jgi:hypothetical protein